jgi:RNA polymerase sigma-70 factor (ECF subfamily)
MPASEAVESEVRALCDAGDHDRAATAALRGYGPELYSFLAALHPRDADDVFAEVSAKLWRGLPRFAWQASLRTWAYTIARNTSHTFRARGGREVALDDASEVGRIAKEVRTATQPYLRTDFKDRFAALRASLPVEDQELLILRIDRELDWKELAQTLADRELAGDELTREAARLRKRFQALKARLLELGRREGLVD